MALPTAPICASTLLDLELEHQAIPPSTRTFLTGIKAIDQSLPPSLLMGGKLIGVGSARARLILVEIISDYLLSYHESILRNREPGIGFIIEPHNSDMISNIHFKIADRMCNALDPKSTMNALQYLEKVQLLQYFDFAGLVESVSEVSAALFQMSNSAAVQKTILYIGGVGLAIENDQRRSGMVRANALLSSLLRTLIHLSRTYPCLLILLDMVPRISKGENTIQSAFASATGSGAEYLPDGAPGRTLADALDVVVVVHDVHDTVTDGGMIVEVVEDRVGGSRGQWAVWHSKK